MEGGSNTPRSAALAPRNAAIVTGHKNGVTVKQLAHNFQVGTRRIYYVLAKARDRPD